MAGHLEPTAFTWEPTVDGGRRKKPMRGTKWKARYRDPDGRARSQTFGRKIDGERFLERIGADIQRGDWQDPTLRRVAFDDWAREWLATGTMHLKPSTMRSYTYVLERRLLPYFGGRPIAAIDRVDVRRFVADTLAAGRSPKTAREYLNVLSLVLQIAQDAGAIRENAAARQKLPRRIRTESLVMTLPQIEALATATPAPYDTLIRLAAHTGLRPGELCGLRIGRIDMIGRRITVAETVQPINGEMVSGPTKTDATRTVVIPASIADAVGRMLAARRAKLGRELMAEDFVFPSLRGGDGPLNRDSFRKWVLLPALRRAGLPEAFRTHDLRHSHAATLISLGAHPKAVSERLGHSDIGVTMNVYGHLFPALEAHLVEGLERLAGEASAAPWKPATVIDLGAESG